MSPILAATNRPDMLDEALLRPGRLERHIYVPAPDEESRKKIFEVYLGGETGNILAKDVDIDSLVKKTEGYVGADIEALVREAKDGGDAGLHRPDGDKERAGAQGCDQERDADKGALRCSPLSSEGLARP